MNDEYSIATRARATKGAEYAVGLTHCKHGHIEMDHHGAESRGPAAVVMLMLRTSSSIGGNGPHGDRKIRVEERTIRTIC